MYLIKIKMELLVALDIVQFILHQDQFICILAVNPVEKGKNNNYFNS